MVRLNPVARCRDVQVTEMAGDDEPHAHAVHARVIRAPVALDVGNGVRLADFPAGTADRMNPVVWIHSIGLIDEGHVSGHGTTFAVHPTAAVSNGRGRGTPEQQSAARGRR